MRLNVSIYTGHRVRLYEYLLLFSHSFVMVIPQNKCNHSMKAYI